MSEEGLVPKMISFTRKKNMCKWKGKLYLLGTAYGRVLGTLWVFIDIVCLDFLFTCCVAKNDHSFRVPCCWLMICCS